MSQTMDASPEEMAEGMEMWKAWAKQVGPNLVDLGAPLVNGMRVHPNGSTGSSTRDVTGYSLIDADDWEELMDLLSGHPHISGWHPEATIEVHETMLIPGM
jgi:muconolactone delta-isomerase